MQHYSLIRSYNTTDPKDKISRELFSETFNINNLKEYNIYYVQEVIKDNYFYFNEEHVDLIKQLLDFNISYFNSIFTYENLFTGYNPKYINTICLLFKCMTIEQIEKTLLIFQNAPFFEYCKNIDLIDFIRRENYLKMTILSENKLLNAYLNLMAFFKTMTSINKELVINTFGQLYISFLKIE